ncbi:YraN family protein [uncultured Senegalimassilia sp.]|uniref:YraN family protein n=1 Tax=uncultured Senegalimassilia sp. TaxID=1714350 RepID=UPI0027DD4F35|nr:YraN family protein [uncultured Senegalimassilia sp.]
MADDLKTGDRMARAAMTTEPMVKEIAERCLVSRGYEILARDWRCAGERVDIVAKDGDVAVLVDVAAGGGELGDEFAEVEAAADRLVRATELFCERFDVERGACRIDCLRFRLRDRDHATIRHYLGAGGLEPAC